MYVLSKQQYVQIACMWTLDMRVSVRSKNDVLDILGCSHTRTHTQAEGDVHTECLAMRTHAQLIECTCYVIVCQGEIRFNVSISSCTNTASFDKCIFHDT